MLHSLVYFTYITRYFLCLSLKLHADEKARNVKSQDSSYLHDAQWHAFYYGCIPGGCIDIIQDSTPSYFSRRHVPVFRLTPASQNLRDEDAGKRRACYWYYFNNNSTFLAAQRIRRCHASELKLDLRLNYWDVSSTIVFERDRAIIVSSESKQCEISGTHSACIERLAKRILLFHYYEQDYKTD